jgi:hypothetical protein
MLAPVQKCLILRAHTYSNETLAYHVQAITSQDEIQEMMKFVIKNREINEKSRGRLMDALMNENTRREVARSRSQPSTVAQERQPFISCEAVNAKYCRPKKGNKASKGRHSRLEVRPMCSNNPGRESVA